MCLAHDISKNKSPVAGMLVENFRIGRTCSKCRNWRKKINKIFLIASIISCSQLYVVPDPLYIRGTRHNAVADVRVPGVVTLQNLVIEYPTTGGFQAIPVNGGTNTERR